LIAEERERLWRAHCFRMAEATQAVADWCEDLDMLRAYIELAARWVKMANEPPTPDRD